MEAVLDKEIGGNKSIAKAGKYLTFILGKEIYGIEILNVQEIIGIMKVTEVPKTPAFVRGVINLRGKVIPVINLRLKFGLDDQKDTERTCIIVLQVKCDNQIFIMGVIVDEVSEVLYILSEQIEESPSFDSSVDLEFIRGMGKVGEKVIMLLDSNKVLLCSEMNIVSKLQK